MTSEMKQCKEKNYYFKLYKPPLNLNRNYIKLILLKTQKFNKDNAFWENKYFSSLGYKS